MIVTLRTRVATVEVEDGLVLLDEVSGHYWRLNATGAVVLRGLLNGDAAVEVAQRLRQRWNVSQTDAERDVVMLLGELRRQGLVT